MSQLVLGAGHAFENATNKSKVPFGIGNRSLVGREVAGRGCEDVEEINIQIKGQKFYILSR